MFLSTPSASFNLTSIEKKLAAIESTSSSSPYTIKTTNRLTKVNNETELDAHLKSERAAFNDEQFEYLTQQSLTQADTDYWEEIFTSSLKRRRNLINCLLADDLRPRSISSYDSASSTKTSQILNDPTTSSTGYDFKSGWTSQQNQSSIFADLSAVEQQYAQTLIKYNQTRTLEGTGDGDQLILQYKHVAKTYETQVVGDMWHAAEWMSGVLDNYYQKSDLFHAQRAVVLCARDYLERSFRLALQATYNDIDLYMCLLSFITSNEKISGLQSVDDRLVDGVSAWPLIFYALRAGDIDLALNIINQANLPHVRTLLETYLSKEQTTTITNISTTTTAAANKASNIRNIEYSLVGNPYKRAVICILDRTNLVDAHEDVLLCVEDFLWIKLAQIQITNETAFNDRTNVQLTIPRLQRWILRDLGEEYFKAYEQPFRYARILLLCGAFESACEFLFKIPLTKVHSIHLAIYFNEKYLLGLTSSIDECMIMIAGSSQQNKTNTALNLPKLIESYLKEKFIHDQRRYWELINYAYALIKIEQLEAGSEFRRLLIDLTTNLDDLHIVYGQWIIATDEDGGEENKIVKLERGLLHQLFSHLDDSDVEDVLISLATTIEKHHRSHLLVASALFELARDYSSCIRLASEYLTQIILDRLLISSSTSTSSPLPFVYELAQRLQILSNTKHNENQQNYFLLLDIYAFVDYYFRTGQHERAFIVLRQLKLFPYGKDDDDDEQVRQLLGSNKWFQQLFPHLCLAALRTHLLVIQQEPSSSLTEEEKNQYEFYRRTASVDLTHLAEFAHMQSQLFTRTQLRSIDRLCEQANQYYDQDMSFH